MIMDKEQRQEIMRKYLKGESTDEGYNMFFAYQEAMQEYAELYHKQESEGLREEVETLTNKNKILMEYYDTHNGTPCEAIRHSDEMDRLKELINTAFFYMTDDADCQIDWEQFKIDHHI